MRELTAAMRPPAMAARAPAPQLLRRRCACGGTPGLDGECAACRRKRLTRGHSGTSTGERLDAGAPAPATAPATAPGVTAPPTAPPVPGPVPPTRAPAAPCTQPVNWSHGPAADNGPDGIRVQISWGSSTGRLADLADCTVREVVRYDPIPNPPFLWRPRNPTILTVPAVLGAGEDTHSYPLGLQTGITDPRAAGTMVAHQQYQFRCTGQGCSGSWEDFANEAYTITREVFAEYVRPNPWRYRITKQGVSNPFRYSREVPIPDPPTRAPAPTPAPVPGPTAPPAVPPGGGAGSGTGAGAGSSFQVCARDLQGRLGLFANHAYIEAPPKRYAVITPLCPAHWWENPATGTVAQKWDNSPDPCGKTPRCVDCTPAPGVTDLATCFRDTFAAYSNPSLYRAAGPNSNTFAGTLARRCCAGMVPKPSVLGNCPGWSDSPAPPRTGASPCPPGPTC
jgi:hypothetical protein